MYREQIQLAKDKVKFLQAQRDANDQRGEEIYNNLRDHISLQEERQKTTGDELTPVKHGLLTEAAQRQVQNNLDISYLRGSIERNDSHKLAA
jgi:hypothetical protein